MHGKRAGSITSTTCIPGSMASTLGAGPADERRVILVVMGSDAQGKKHLVVLDEAMSESEMSWREILHDLKALRLALAALGHR